MNAQDKVELVTILSRIQAQAILEHVRVTQHAQQEMVEEDVTLDEVLQVGTTGKILEHYPEHKRGACGLLLGRTRRGRVLHIVCTTAQPILIIITVYEPKLPKWTTPTQRRR